MGVITSDAKHSTNYKCAGSSPQLALFDALYRNWQDIIDTWQKDFHKYHLNSVLAAAIS
jgi:hypothetical protein